MVGSAAINFTWIAGAAQYINLAYIGFFGGQTFAIEQGIRKVSCLFKRELKTPLLSELADTIYILAFNCPKFKAVVEISFTGVDLIGCSQYRRTRCRRLAFEHVQSSCTHLELISDIAFRRGTFGPKYNPDRTC